MTTVPVLLKWGQEALCAAAIDTARLDAEYLLADVLHLDSLSSLYLYQSDLSDQDKNSFEAMIKRREAREPVAHIIGHTEFWSLKFKVTADTLVPRQDSETLVDHVIEFARNMQSPKVLDLGTGSGCLLLSVLHEIPTATGVGLDQGLGALSVAQENAVSLSLQSRISFQQSDWFSSLTASDGPFDCIMSNPPYIPSQDCTELMADVRDFEPMTALDGGMDGLRDYRVIIHAAKTWLVDGGMLAFECGIGQIPAIKALLVAAYYSNIQVKRDLPGVERVISAIK